MKTTIEIETCPRTGLHRWTCAGCNRIGAWLERLPAAEWNAFVHEESSEHRRHVLSKEEVTP